MNSKEIAAELDKIYFRLTRSDELSIREYQVLQNANRLRYTILANHTLTVKQRIEALLLVHDIFVQDINNARMKKRVDAAIGYAYANMTFLGPGAFADIIGAKVSRVSSAYEAYQQEQQEQRKRA